MREATDLVAGETVRDVPRDVLRREPQALSTVRGVLPVFCAAALAPRGVVVKRLLTGIGLMAVELLTATLEA